MGVSGRINKEGKIIKWWPRIGARLVFVLIVGLAAMVLGMGRTGAAEEGVVWRLPYEKGESLVVTQGYKTNFTHTAASSDAYAIDFAKNGCEIYGKPAVVAEEGKVIETYGEMTKEGYGIMAKIQHKDGTFSLYAHLSSLAVKKGDEVANFQVVGYMGNTGKVAGVACKEYPGAHLHFAVKERIYEYQGKYYGKAHLAEPISKYTAIKEGKWYVSDNGPEDLEKNDVANGNEDDEQVEEDEPKIEKEILGEKVYNTSTDAMVSSTPNVLADNFWSFGGGLSGGGGSGAGSGGGGGNSNVGGSGSTGENGTDEEVNQTTTDEEVNLEFYVFDKDSESKEFTNDLKVGIAINTTGTFNEWFLAEGDDSGDWETSSVVVEGWQENKPTEWELGVGEGEKNVFLLAKDDEGKIYERRAKIILDQTAPSARVNDLEPLMLTEIFEVSWVGTDNLSGVDYYQAQYRTGDEGEWNFWSWLGENTEKIFGGSLNFKGQSGKEYNFRARAVDKAGNWGIWPEWPDTWTLVEARGAEYLSVVINEIGWMGTEADENGEWIEIFNNEARPIDMTGWKLKGENVDGGAWEVDLGGTSAARSGVIDGFEYAVWSRQGALREVLGEVRNLPDEVGLDDGGVVLAIYDNHNRLIDKVDCKNGWFAGEKMSRDEAKNVVEDEAFEAALSGRAVSMERVNSRGEGSDSNNWREQRDEILNYGKDSEGGIVHGTPSLPNSTSFPEAGSGEDEARGGAGDESGVEVNDGGESSDGRAMAAKTVIWSTRTSSTTSGDFAFTKEGSPYLILGGTRIFRGNVTIEPGVIIKIGPPSGNNFYWPADLKITGTLTAIGTEDEPIVITSDYDLEYRNGTKAVNPGYNAGLSTLGWGQIWASGDSLLEHVIMRWGDGVRLIGGKTRLSHCRLEGMSGNSGWDFTDLPYGLISVSGEAEATVEDSVFTGRDWGAVGIGLKQSQVRAERNQFSYLGEVVSFSDYEGGEPEKVNFNGNIVAHNNLVFNKTAVGNLDLFENNYQDNDKNYVRIRKNKGEWDGEARVFNDQTWYGEIPYVLNQYISFSVTSTLTMEAGLLVYMPPVSSPYPSGCNLESSGLGVGNLVARGTDERPIILTNYNDPKYAGGPGISEDYSYCIDKWGGLDLNNSEGEYDLEGVIFRRGGATLGFEEIGALNISGTKGTKASGLEFFENENAIKIKNCGEAELLKSKFGREGGGVELNNSSGIFEDNQFEDNVAGVMIKNGSGWSIKGNEANVATMINYTEYMESGGALRPVKINGTTMWGKNKNMPYVVSGRAEVSESLAIEPGVVVKFKKQWEEGQIWVMEPDGKLHWRGTEGEPIILTSFKDDEDGDTNGDGRASEPAGGDWEGVYLVGATGNILERVDMKYGGKSGGINNWAGMLVLDGAGAMIEDCVFEWSGGAGMRWVRVETGDLELERCEFKNNEVGIAIDSYSNGPWGEMSGQIFEGNRQYAVLNNGVGVLEARNNWWGSAEGPRVSGENSTSTGDLINKKVIFSPWLTERP